GNSGSFGELVPVAPGDLVQAVMGSPAAQRHGEPGLLERELILAVADGRPCGQDVIERRQAVDATRLLVQREILAMSVGRCKQPEGELCEHEGCLVARGMLAVRSEEHTSELQSLPTIS